MKRLRDELAMNRSPALLLAVCLSCSLATSLLTGTARAQAPLSEKELEKLETQFRKAGARPYLNKEQVWEVNLDSRANMPEVIALLPRLPGNVSLDDWDHQITDDHLGAIAKLKNIHGLDLGHSKRVTDAGLKHLAESRSLKHLDLDSLEGITSTGLAHVGQMSQLESLNLFGVIMEFQTKHLSKLTRLKKLDLPVTQVTDRDLIPLAELKNLEELNLAHANISGEGLVNLAGLTKLTKLNLSITGVNDAGLRHLARLTELRELDLQRTEVSNAGLVHLAAMRQLEYLWLNRTHVRSPGMKHLAGMKKLSLLGLEVLEDFTGEGMEHLAGCAELTWVDLRWTAVTDAGLAQIKKLPQVTSLLLPEYGIPSVWLSEFWDDPHPERFSDAGLKHVGEMTNLEQLQFSGAITDAGLAHLVSLQKLKTLHIEHVPGIKGPGLVHLKKLPKLTELDLSKTGVTDAGLEHLIGHERLLILTLPPLATAKCAPHLQKMPALKMIHYPEEISKEDIRALREALPGVAFLRK
jgi:Leucine-rich repeat (LRR) protein